MRGVTEVNTTSVEARALGKGVCQDFAHVALALLRAAGLPARYVSGYLYPGKEPAVLDEPVKAESHAWVEFWAGDWVAADPSNLSEVADRHVIVARGRDYADVRPLTGSTPVRVPARSASPSSSPACADPIPAPTGPRHRWRSWFAPPRREGVADAVESTQ